MKKIILTLLILIPILILINHINKVIFMNDLKKSLNGLYINLGDFLKNSEPVFTPYKCVFYNKDFEKNFKDNKGIKIFSANGNKILFTSDKEFNINNKLEKQIGNLMEYDIKTNKSIPLTTIDKKYNKTDILSKASYFNNGIVLIFDDKVLLLKQNKEIEEIYKEKDISISYPIIRRNILYFEVYNYGEEYYDGTHSLNYNGLYLYTPQNELLKYIQAKNKILNVNTSSINVKYSINSFDFEKIGNTSSYISEDFYKKELFTKDGKYRIFFKKKYKFSIMYPIINTKIYAENIKTKRKICIFETTTKYEESYSYEFKNDDLDRVFESIYDWTIF